MLGISVGGMLPLNTTLLLSLHEHWMMLATLFQSVAFLQAQQACGLSLSPFRHRNEKWSASPHLRALKLWQMELNQKSQTHKRWLMLCGSSWTANSENAKDAAEHVLLPSSPFLFRSGRHFLVSFHFAQVLCTCWSLAEVLWWGFPPLLLCLPAYWFSCSVPCSIIQMTRSGGSAVQPCFFFPLFIFPSLKWPKSDGDFSGCSHWRIFAQHLYSWYWFLHKVSIPAPPFPAPWSNFEKTEFFFWGLTSDQRGHGKISCGIKHLRFIPIQGIAWLQFTKSPYHHGQFWIRRGQKLNLVHKLLAF